MSDVAPACGVSQATLSLVPNGAAGTPIPDRTRADPPTGTRVIRAA